VSGGSGSGGGGGSGASNSNVMRNIYQNTARQYSHHSPHHQYPVGAAAAASVMNNAMSGLGRYTSAQHMANSMSNIAAAAVAATSPYNSMAAQFTGMPPVSATQPTGMAMNFQDHMLHYQSY
jgi:hypothetical protein